VRAAPGTAHYVTHERGPDGSPLYCIRDADTGALVASRPFLTLAYLAADALARGETIDREA
jgi:hypothetical protein